MKLFDGNRLLHDAQSISFSEKHGGWRIGADVFFADPERRYYTVPGTPPPASVDLLAFVFVLEDAGTQESVVDAAIAALPAGAAKRKLRAWWNKSTEIKRRSPQLAALAAVMSWTDAQLDGWFIAAEGVDL